MSDQHETQEQQTHYLPTREELAEAEKYLQALDLPADEWILTNHQQFWRVGEVAGMAFDQDGGAIRNAAERGDIPHSVMLPGKTGWRFDRGGLIWWVAHLRGWKSSRERALEHQSRQSAG